MALEKRNIGISKDELRARTLQKAYAFITIWADGKHEERQEAQQFEKDFLDVFGLNFRLAKLKHKARGKDKKIKYVDLFWPGELLIEMKTSGSPKYSNGEADTQAFDYLSCIDKSVDLPKVIMVSDFNNVRLFDLRPYIQNGLWTGEKPEPVEFQLKDLTEDENFVILQFLVGREDLCKAQPEVSQVAAEELGKLYNLLLEKNYNEQDRILFIMRIMFCLFAENTHIFNDNQFANYILESIDHGQNVALRLALLFKILDTEEDKRPYLACPWNESIKDPSLLFPYVDGGLFAVIIKTPPITNNEAYEFIVKNCSTMDWSKVSPSIFGALFQSIRTKTERRKLGEHYTSVENIEKVLDPLFLDDLNNELQNIINESNGRKEIKLKNFQENLGKLQLLDPACGCGNFLIVAYQRLRDLEFRTVKELYTLKKDSVQQSLGVSILRKVKLSQLHGIEIDPFPCMIAMTSAWLQDHLENERLSTLVGEHIPTIPLIDSANIICQNALHLDWETCFPDMQNKSFNYIFGNPPFNGARTMNKEQKGDMKLVFSGLKGIGDLDYVTAWFWKSANYIHDHETCSAAFVSTNSITQGQQVALLWKHLFEKIYIRFAYRTFKWINEAKGVAAVHCVIIGMESNKLNSNKRMLWNENNQLSFVNKINPYLLDAETIFIDNREKPLCNVPSMGIGNKPIDGGFYIFSKDEKENFINQEPLAKKYFYGFIGSREFLYNIDRYILKVSDIPPDVLKKMPHTLEIVDKVKEFRLSSKSKPTKKLALTPKEFHVTNIPDCDYIVIPEVTSHHREYIPIGIISKKILASNLLKIIPSSSLYIFAILSSSIHMTWIKYIAGRLGEGYRYSSGIVYNNFPWPTEPEIKNKLNIETLASNILSIRKKYPKSCLADLYNPITMPTDLLKAHKKLDKAVLKLYGLKVNSTDEEILATLFSMYKNYLQPDDE